MYSFGLIDGIIKEPAGGAQSNPEEMAKILKKHLKQTLAEVSEIPLDALLKQRIEKYSNMGPYQTLEDVPAERVVVFD